MYTLYLAENDIFVVPCLYMRLSTILRNNPCLVEGRLCSDRYKFASMAALSGMEQQLWMTG